MLLLDFCSQLCHIRWPGVQLSVGYRKPRYHIGLCSLYSTCYEAVVIYYFVDWLTFLLSHGVYYRVV